ncbi:TTF-type domain-containing protein [Aphis craccivora]|uniref:TTF-type domain-containing protein n=1 Tax=Aphis craccivora TaxID=307492 RepID=A0A6G0YUK5_APHCR|nr:TTF-type domain-containing protein [Aphis craccivora]
MGSSQRMKFGSRPGGLVWTLNWQNFYLSTRGFLLCPGWGMAASLYRHHDLSKERCRPLPRFELAMVRIATDALERLATPSPTLH